MQSLLVMSELIFIQDNCGNKKGWVSIIPRLLQLANKNVFLVF